MVKNPYEAKKQTKDESAASNKEPEPTDEATGDNMLAKSLDKDDVDASPSSSENNSNIGDSTAAAASGSESKAVAAADQEKVVPVKKALFASIASRFTKKKKAPVEDSKAAGGD